MHPRPLGLRCFSTTAAIGRAQRAASHGGDGHHAAGSVPCDSNRLGTAERSASALLPIPVTPAREPGQDTSPNPCDTGSAAPVSVCRLRVPVPAPLAIPSCAGSAALAGRAVDARARRPCPRAQEGAGDVGHVRPVPESAAAKAASPEREGAAGQGDAQGAAARPRGGAGAAAVSGRERERHGRGGRGGAGGTGERRAAAAAAAASRAEGAGYGVGQGGGGGGTAGA